MGNFDKETVPLKKMARQGQLFSTTKTITELSANEIETICDIERNGYCFTDGIGNISAEVKKLIDNKYEVD